VHFAAAHRQRKQMQANSAANSDYHAENSAVGQTEDHMAEAIIKDLANLATATANDCGAVVTLTEENSRLAKQLEYRSHELTDIKTLLKKERAERKGQRTCSHSPYNYCWTRGQKGCNSHTSISCNYPKHGNKREATKVDNMGGSQENRE
jgi:hypothetical protein